MSNISASSSASQQPVTLLPPVMPPVMVDVAAIAQSDVALAKQCARGYYSAYIAYVNAISGVTASPVSSDVSSSSKGSTTRKFFRRSLSPVPSALTVRRLGSGASGYCYLAAFREAEHDRVALELGVNPTFFQLLAQPKSRFVDFAELERLSVVESGGKAHIGSHLRGESFLPVFRGLARRCAPAVVPDSICGYLRSDGGVVAPSLYGGSTEVGVVALKELLAKFLDDVDLSDPGADEDMLMAVKSNASLSVPQKNRARMFEAVGDSVLTSYVAELCLKRGSDAQTYQEARSSCTSNNSLSQVFVRNFDPSYFSVPAGVDAGHGKVGANFVEVIVGVVSHHFGKEVAYKLVHRLGVFSSTQLENAEG